MLKLISVLTLSFTLLAGISPAEAQTNAFDVRKFGATGDGATLDTAAIQAALDACGKAGGGIVELPAGNYLSKPIFLRSQTTFQLDAGATLQARDEHADFLDADGVTLAFVNGKNLADVTISGTGIIDGAGARWWEPVRAAKRTGARETVRRPRLIVLSNCRNLVVRDVTLQNSPSFHLVPVECENVTITNVTIQAPADSPNTDAMDPSACRHVLITKCHVSVGDDNIAIKSGHAVAGRAAACEDFVVSNCTFLRGHGLSIGSETAGGVKNMLVTNCTFDGTTSGIRIKTSREKGGTVEDLVYRDITMTNVTIPINITCYYPKVPATDTAQPVTRTTPVYRNIRIENLTAYGPKSAGFIVGLPEKVITDVTLENVHLFTDTGLLVRNATGIHFKNSTITVANQPEIKVENAQVDGLPEANHP